MTPADLRRALAAWMPKAFAEEAEVRHNSTRRRNGKAVLRSKLMTEITTTHSEAEEAYLESLYAQLKPEANLMYVNWFLARTPAHLQEDMKDLIEQGLEPPPPPVRSNMGAPTHQRVDVEAIAQAAAHSLGTVRAREKRDEALANLSLNPGNPDKPLVNIEPGEDGPNIMPGDPPGSPAAASPGYQTTTLTPPHPEQISDTPAIAPDQSVLPDSYEPPRRY